MSAELPVDCVLFDLDGTLVDTAPDLIGALNRLRAEEGLPPADADKLRPHVSNGAAAILREGMPAAPDEVTRERRRRRYLDLYGERVCDASVLFPGIPKLLDWLDAQPIVWGVVTNKPAWLTEPLLDALHITPRARVVVSGDTLPTKKPDPAPILHACQACGVTPERTVYVGDSARDIEAARRAGARSVAALYGYVAPEPPWREWGADVVVEGVEELARRLGPEWE